MAAIIFTDAFLSVKTVDLSSQVRSLTLTYSAELLDASAMGVGATRARVKGLLDWNLSVEFLQSFAAANVDATLFPMIATDTTSGAIIVRPVKATAVGATNPNFTGNAFLESYPPLSGGVADLAVVTAQFQGDGVLTRATS